MLESLPRKLIIVANRSQIKPNSYRYTSVKHTSLFLQISVKLYKLLVIKGTGLNKGHNTTLLMLQVSYTKNVLIYLFVRVLDATPRDFCHMLHIIHCPLILYQFTFMRQVLDRALRDLYHLLKHVERTETDAVLLTHTDRGLEVLDKFMKDFLFPEQTLTKKISVLDPPGQS